MPMITNTVDCLEKKLAETETKLAKLRNFRADVGSKIIVEDAWRRYLEQQIQTLRAMQIKPTNPLSVQKCTQGDAIWK